MDYATLMKENKYEDLIGKTVWICDYRHNDLLQKPIRHIKPTEAIIARNDDLPKGKTVYYADIHFRPIGKKGTPLKQVIAPYDNTGFRSYTGVSLNIFFTREECIEKYIEQSEVVKEEIEVKRKRMNDRFDEMSRNIDEALIKLKNSLQ